MRLDACIHSERPLSYVTPQAMDEGERGSGWWRKGCLLELSEELGRGALSCAVSKVENWK
jgi:hypothetical protein